jgi:tartrate-resistant acid phosphatase type 5
MANHVSRRSFLAALAALALKRSQAEATESGLPFLVVGDWGTGSAAQKRLAVAMGRTADAVGARFIISTGDNFYPAGVTSVEDPQWKTSFEDMYDAPSLMIPWYAVLGNHDHKGNVRAQVTYTQRSSRWRMPDAHYKHAEVLTGGSSAEFFFIDTTPIVRQHTSWTGRFSTNEEIAWLGSELASSTARWKIVVGHHPAHTGEPGKASRALIDWLVPLLERHRVQVYLNGHSHNLEHIVVRGVHYLTSGAGANPRNASPVGGTRFVREQQLGFAVARLSPDAIDIEFWDDAGNSLYRAKV